MLDFTRATYLGIDHPARLLEPWRRLTTGVPAALLTPTAQDRLARELATLVGCERVALARSTFHLMWDLFGLIGRDCPVIYVDQHVYPVSLWAVERAEARGAVVRRFAHHDGDHLRVLVSQDGSGFRGRRCVVVTDGWCPRCGRLAPIDQYLDLVRRAGGLLVIDDTQAIGILGDRRASPASAYGLGGGGTLRWLGVGAAHCLVVASLAKAFGAPLAMLGGSERCIRSFDALSRTRVHCSPPSAADLGAARHALDVNAAAGDRLRRRLLRLVLGFRESLALVGVRSTGGPFPVQTISGEPGRLRSLYRQARRCGVRCVPLRPDGHHPLQLAFLLNAGLRASDVRTAAEAMSAQPNCSSSSIGKDPSHALP